MIETRGRPPSEEHVSLLTMKIGESFVSGKSRESLYQIARTLGVKVKILSEGNGEWRVWKRSLAGERPIARAEAARLQKEREQAEPRKIKYTLNPNPLIIKHPPRPLTNRYGRGKRKEKTDGEKVD